MVSPGCKQDKHEKWMVGFQTGLFRLHTSPPLSDDTRFQGDSPTLQWAAWTLQAVGMDQAALRIAAGQVDERVQDWVGGPGSRGCMQEQCPQRGLALTYICVVRHVVVR